MWQTRARRAGALALLWVGALAVGAPGDDLPASPDWRPRHVPIGSPCHVVERVELGYGASLRGSTPERRLFRSPAPDALGFTDVGYTCGSSPWSQHLWRDHPTPAAASAHFADLEAQLRERYGVPDFDGPGLGPWDRLVYWLTTLMGEASGPPSWITWRTADLDVLLDRRTTEGGERVILLLERVAEDQASQGRDARSA